MEPRFWEAPNALHNIRDLIAYLDAQDEGELERADLFYLLEKPWKYEPEYEEMRAQERALLDHESSPTTHFDDLEIAVTSADPIAAALTDATLERMSR